MESRFNAAASWQPYAGPGGWNDMDSVEVGNGSNDGLTLAERQTQLSLWALASSPLILGTDLTALDSGDLALLKNSAVTGVDQDAIPADRLTGTGNEQVFDKRQQKAGDYVLGIFNTDTSASHSFTVNLAQLGLAGSANLTDLWAGSSLGSAYFGHRHRGPGRRRVADQGDADLGHRWNRGTEAVGPSGKCVDTFLLYH